MATRRDQHSGRERRLGIALVAASAVLWSSAGLFVRLSALDTPTLVLWRSLFAAITLAAMALWRGGAGAFGRALADRRIAALFVATSVVSSTAYVLSLRLTSVAVVMSVYATLPFLAGAIGWLWIGERVTRRFVIAGAAALGAIVLMAGGAAGWGDVLGMVAALVMTLGFAVVLVAIRRHGAVEFVPLNALAALACIPVVLPFAQVGVPGPQALASAAVYGVLTTGLAYVLALEGGRRIAPGEAGFIALLDVVLGPLWVWLVFGEWPGLVVIAGCAVVLGAVGWYLAAPGGAVGAARRRA